MDLKDHLVPTLPVFVPTELLRAPSCLALSISRFGTPTPSLDKLCQCHTTLTGKDFLLCKLPLFQSESFPLSLSIHTPVKILRHLSCRLSWKMEGCTWVTPKPFLFQAEQSLFSPPFFITYPV